MRLPERLEALEALLDRLRVDNATTPILVEGPRDREALTALGCRGQLIVFHDGDSLMGTADRLGRQYERIILLSDWDRTGGTIHRRMKEALTAHGVVCDESYRKELAHLATKTTRAVEDLPDFLVFLRERVGVPR